MFFPYNSKTRVGRHVLISGDIESAQLATVLPCSDTWSLSQVSCIPRWFLQG